MSYFANGTEGEILDMQCHECRLPNDAPCPILFVQSHYNYSQIGNKLLEECLNLLVSEKGECLMKPLLDALPDQRISK